MNPAFRKIKLKDYQNINLSKQWYKNISVPNYFLKRLNVTPQTSFHALLAQIQKELRLLYGKKRDTGKSFKDSRFTPVSQALKRGMVSCGALTQIYGGVLRKHNIPVKFVHGRMKWQRGDSRHAWLKIYNPIKKDWIIIDPANNFKLPKTARPLKIYSGWKELKKDYLKGKF